MAWTPENSRVRVDAALEEKINGASAEEIKEIMKSEMVSQGFVKRDWDPELFIENPIGTAPRAHARAVTINGTKHVVEGATEIELEKAVGDLYRAQLTPAATTQQTEQPRDISTGRFVSAEEAANKAELELQFKRGDISAADYLQKSGAISDFLEQQGVPLEDLKAQVAEKQGQKLEQSWADATEEFKARNPEWHAHACEGNKNIIGQLLVENNLIDAEDKVAALERAFNHARENNLLGANPDTEYQRELQEARSPEEINAVNHKYFGGSGSGLFNR
jgi:hypothetical protein